MEAMQAILSRRSIRKYKPLPVSDNVITDALKAAMSAPSAGNEQPWHFIVIKDRAVLDEIPKYHPYSAMTKEAHVAVLVCADLNLETRQGYWVQDCAAATENLLVSINATGLGAVWLGVYPREDRVKGLRGLFKLPENVIPFSLIPIGHPAEEKPPSNRFNPERIHYDKW